ncbi:MAG TPA: M23 family metallopeptidase [Bacteroidales bacterium]|nr:M23 family metallopeptidase [Bacteroidales bacterium]HPR57529.1 M23 family metallopeptidase [Bacteroidales bacterium]HRW96622.1 M23 family metallopeptidase [Bacteroidales bacterium]
MGKTKYHFNPVTITFEIVKYPFRRKFGRFLLYLLAAGLYAILVLFIAYKFHDSPKERILKRELSHMEFQYRVLNDRLDQITEVIEDLQDRDDNIYRIIFEAEPVPSAVRKAGYGGVNRYDRLDGYIYSNLLKATTEKIDQITSQLVVQSKSFDEVFEMAKNKAQFIASIPAIQPVSNKDLRRLSSYYGYRMDPFYKVMKFHEGVDFSAPIGTEIYATGDGIVVSVEKSRSHYGNNVLIDHGFNYETFYAHCKDIKVKPGQHVKRGQIIATVGNTGKSTGPHLHYEVRKNNKPINPINFFFNDITPEDYELMIELSSRPSQTMD